MGVTSIGDLFQVKLGRTVFDMYSLIEVKHKMRGATWSGVYGDPFC